MSYIGALKLVEKGNFQPDIYQMALAGAGNNRRIYSNDRLLIAIQIGAQNLIEQLTPWIDEPGVWRFLDKFEKIEQTASDGKIPALKDVKSCFPKGGKIDLSY